MWLLVHTLMIAAGTLVALDVALVLRAGPRVPYVVGGVALAVYAETLLRWWLASAHGWGWLMW